MSYSDLPHKPTIPVEPFKLSVPHEDLNELLTLLKSTRIAKESYENVSAQENKFGITRKWLVNMKDEWIKLDWWVCIFTMTSNQAKRSRWLTCTSQA